VLCYFLFVEKFWKLTVLHLSPTATTTHSRTKRYFLRKIKVQLTLGRGAYTLYANDVECVRKSGESLGRRTLCCRIWVIPPAPSSHHPNTPPICAESQHSVFAHKSTPTEDTIVYCIVCNLDVTDYLGRFWQKVTEWFGCLEGLQTAPCLRATATTTSKVSAAAVGSIAWFLLRQAWLQHWCRLSACPSCQFGLARRTSLRAAITMLVGATGKNAPMRVVAAFSTPPCGNRW